MIAGSGFPPVLIDWSAYARITLTRDRPDSGRRLGRAEVDAFQDALLGDRVYVSPPFRVEALYSARAQADFLLLADYLEGLRQADGNAETWLIAERTQSELGHAPGVSHRVSLSDLLLASIASQHGLGVLHYDGDFDLLAEHTSLEFESVWIAPVGSVD